MSEICLGRSVSWCFVDKFGDSEIVATNSGGETFGLKSEDDKFASEDSSRSTGSRDESGRLPSSVDCNSSGSASSFDSVPVS